MTVAFPGLVTDTEIRAVYLHPVTSSETQTLMVATESLDNSFDTL